MQAIKCELCGSNQLIKKDGFFQCEYCGTKYTLEEAKKLFVSGTVSVEGEVRTKDADFIIKAGVLEKYNGESDMVTVPDGVKELGKECFAGAAIVQVQLPASLIKIGQGAFKGCKYLKQITIPKGVTAIGGDAFDGCSALSSVDIPDTVTLIDGYAFRNCTALTEISIPDSVTLIGTGAFSGSGLRSVTLPDSTAEIGNPRLAGYVFEGCKSLTEVILPRGIERIEGFTFRYCDSLRSVTIPDSVTEIGDVAFYGCKSLTEVTFPDSVKKIGRRAFAGCTGLTAVTIPDSTAEIGNPRLAGYVFEGCKSLDPQRISVSPRSEQIFRGAGFVEKGFCEYCAGPLKKKLLSGLRCTRCGKYAE